MTNSRLLRYPNEAYVTECTFETARSGGKGGQHVNKTESKVTLVFDLENSNLFDNNEKNLIAQKLKSHYSSGIIRVSSERSRSQIQNKKLAILLFLELLEKSLYVKPKRKPTKISKAQKEQRLKAKKKAGEKKKSRRKPDLD